MKKLLTFICLSFILFSCTTINVLKPQSRMYGSEISETINASGTHFDGQANDKSWGNKTEENYSFAKFKNYNNGSYVNLEISHPVKIEIHQIVTLNTGKLYFKIKQNDGILKEKLFQSRAEDFFQVEFEKPGNYQLYWTGENANGSYFIEWKELN